MDQDVRLTGQARLNEFRFNQLFNSFQISASPFVTNSVVVLIDNLCDRVWLNGDIEWRANFGGTAGVVTVRFEIFRNDTLIYSTQQSVSGSTFITVTNQAKLQHVDINPVLTPGITPVLYQIRATVQSSPAGSTIFMQDRVFSASEIKTKTPISSMTI